MAYGLRSISSLDLKPSTAIGVKVPFSAPNAFTSVYTTKEQTKYNLINFLLTDRGERPMNPTFGAGLRSTLFEQISDTTLDELQLSLANKLESNFPNVEIVNLAVNGQPNTGEISISFSYRLKSTSETDTATIVVQSI